MARLIFGNPTLEVKCLVMLGLCVMTAQGADVPLKLTLRDLSQPRASVPGVRGARLREGLLVEASQTKHILKGDVIVQIDNQRIPNLHVYQQWLAAAQGGEVHDFTMYRRTKLGYYQRELVRVIVPNGKVTQDSVGRFARREVTLNEHSPAIVAYLAEQSRRQSMTNDPRKMPVKFDKKEGYLPTVGRIGYAGDVVYSGELERGKVLVNIAGTDFVMPSLADALHRPFLVGPAVRYTTAAQNTGTALTAEPFDLEAILAKRE